MITTLLMQLACTPSAEPTSPADTAATEQWQPGDAIPGWPSGDCVIPDEVVSDGYEVEWPFLVNRSRLSWQGAEPAFETALSRNLCGSDDPGCDEGGVVPGGFGFAAVLRLSHVGEGLHLASEADCLAAVRASAPSVGAGLVDRNPGGTADIVVADECQTS